MKKTLIVMLLLLGSILAQAQDTMVLHQLDRIEKKIDRILTSEHTPTTPTDTVSIDTITHTGVTIKDLVGINGGLLLRGFDDKFGWVNNHRIFYLTSHDMQGREIKDFTPSPCESVCPNIDCDWKNTNAAWKYRLCDYTNTFNFNTISLENQIDSKGKPRPYPDKFWTKKELGKDPYKKGYEYGKMLAISLIGLVDAIEVGNELHGAPGLDYARKWSYGVADGVRSITNKIAVVSPDLSAREETFNGKSIQTNIADWDLSKFDIVQMHEYGLDSNFQATLPPEDFLIPELSALRQKYDGKIWIGEFGFSSEIGENKQADYILRSYLIALRYGCEKAFLYAGVDDGPWAAPFDHTGIVTMKGKEKYAYIALRNFVKNYGDYTFHKAIKDGPTDYEYQLIHGDKIATIKWTYQNGSVNIEPIQEWSNGIRTAVRLPASKKESKIIPKGGVRPDLMPTKSPASTDAIYTQEDGTLKKVLFSDAKNYFNTDDQQLTQFNLDQATNILTITLEDGGTKTVDLSALNLDGSDDQQITDFSLAANILTITLEDGGTKTVDLSDLSHTGTTGSVFFAGADGKPTEDNGSLFWDNVNKQLGVGTQPLAPLTVKTNGTTKLGLKIIRHNANNQFINISEGDGGSHLIQASSEDNPKPFSIDNMDEMPIHFRTDGQYRMIVSAGGNVGIGTTTPIEKLEINGAIKIGSNGGTSILFPSGKAIRERVSSPTSIMFLDMGDIRIRGGDALPYSAGLSVGGSKFVVKNNAQGYVGVGTPTPTERFEVVGKGKFSEQVSGADAINPTDFVTKQQLDASGDNLGNHTATQDIIAGDNDITFGDFSIGVSYTSLRIKHQGMSALNVSTAGTVSIPDLDCSLRINRVKDTNSASGNYGDILVAGNSTAGGNVVSWKPFRPTIGTSTSKVFVKAASSFTYSTQLDEGQTGYVENMTTGNINITAPSGITFSTKMTSSQILTIAGHQTVTFIRDDNDEYRVISIW